MINQSILQNLLCSHSKVQMKKFNKTFTETYLNGDYNPSPKNNRKTHRNKTNQKRYINDNRDNDNRDNRNNDNRDEVDREEEINSQINATIQSLYYSEYQSKLVECLVFETIPFGDEIRETEEMPRLLLEDGVLIKQHLLAFD